ncbi:MAG: cellulose biosynthesis (CelD)-like protein [Solirubrobacterales bacterium]|nr:cellulose biosynthesis (CelD)-like protein [Solirubrobacterales bacterium]
MITVTVVSELADARALASPWDDLACALGRPMCAPGWLLLWWEDSAPSHGELAVAAVHDGPVLVGLAPWFLDRGHRGRKDLRLLGAARSDRLDVLAAPGYEDAVARALAAVVRDRLRPDVLAFEGIPAGSDSPRRLLEALGGRRAGRAFVTAVHGAPTVTLPAGEPGEWFAGRSKNFRSEMGRMRRRLAKRSGEVRLVREPEETRRALAALEVLHRGRWDWRGGTGFLTGAMSTMLPKLATALGPDRFRLWTIDVEGEIVSVQVFMAAGSEVKYWNGGWDEAHADVKPTMLTILAALEDAIARGQRRLDLGVGVYPYKLRFADGDDPATWRGVILRNRRYLRSSLETTPGELRLRVRRRVDALPEAPRERILAAVRSVRR